jgi:hypothetical protein
VFCGFGGHGSVQVVMVVGFVQQFGGQALALAPSVEVRSVVIDAEVARKP